MAFTPEAFKTALLTHKKWSYFELSSESYLEGKGDVSGRLQLKPWPSNFLTGFQLGNGGNGWDKDLGLAGLFEYRGNILIRGKKYSVKGIGSLNADAEKCLEDCTPLIDENSLVSNAALTEAFSENTPAVFPNPASEFVRIKTSQIQGTYLVKLIDDTGQLQQQQQLEAEDGIVTLSLRQPQPGIYHLIITSSQGQVESHRIIVR
jgi:hypothetical protein